MSWLKPSGTCMIGEKESVLPASTFDALIRPGHTAKAWRMPVQELELTVIQAVDEISGNSSAACKRFDDRLEQYQTCPIPIRVVLRALGQKPKPRNAPPFISRDQILERYIKELEQQRERFHVHTKKSERLLQIIAKCDELIINLQHHLLN